MRRPALAINRRWAVLTLNNRLLCNLCAFASMFSSDLAHVFG